MKMVIKVCTIEKSKWVIIFFVESPIKGKCERDQIFLKTNLNIFLIIGCISSRSKSEKHMPDFHPNFSAKYGHPRSLGYSCILHQNVFSCSCYHNRYGTVCFTEVLFWAQCRRKKVWCIDWWSSRWRMGKWVTNNFLDINIYLLDFTHDCLVK